ncbi:MAG TPA: sugar phosphate isomerase/epimerase [Candidatus Solibacter sp.]|nr:sugar phosphate isomerase/epimerase [Candidatus Solibacter sp.]
MLRRTFLQTLPAAAAMAGASADEVPVKLGFDTYSLRAFQWKGVELLDYAANLKLDTIQFSALEDYGGLDARNLQKVKDTAARHRIAIDSGMGCICESSKAFDKHGRPVREQLSEGLRVTKAVGSTAMRCYMGRSDDRLGPLPIEAHMENTIKVFRQVRSEALDLGVKIALENHAGDMQAREVKTIIEEAGKDYVAACLDTGNPVWCIEDPFVALETLAPYVVTTHVRYSIVFETPRGAAFQWVALGDGNVDLARFVQQFRKLCPKSSMQLEIITGRPPRELPYLEADFWKAFPKMPGWEFARFVALARSGRPFMGAMVIEDIPGQKPAAPVMLEALKEQQRIDLERSFEYARKKLNVGVNWRA